MNRVLRESFRLAPGRPCPQIWCCRLVKRDGGYQVRFFSQEKGQQADGREFHPSSETFGSFGSAEGCFDKLVADKERQGWDDGIAADGPIERWLGEVWEDERRGSPWQPTVWTAASADQGIPLLTSDRYLLQRWYDLPVIRISMDGPHPLALDEHGYEAPLTPRLWEALGQWQFSHGDLDVEACVCRSYDGLYLTDWIDPPGAARRALDRAQVISQAVLPGPLFRAAVGYSKEYKQALWKEALDPHAGWDGVILRRTDVAHRNGPSDLDFRIDLRRKGYYLVEALHPKTRGRSRTLAVGFPTVEGGWQSLGSVSGPHLTARDWATLERFRDCGADAVVQVQYAWWEPAEKRLVAGKVVRLEPRLCRGDCVDAGAHLISGTHYLF